METKAADNTDPDNVIAKGTDDQTLRARLIFKF
jgi:hypothetical protein